MGKLGKCVVCGQKFQAKKKGYKRYSLQSQLGLGFNIDVAAALAKTLPGLQLRGKFPAAEEGSHVCDSCFRLLRTTLRHREQLLKTEIEWTNRISQGPHRKTMLKSRSRNVKKKSKQSKSVVGSRSSSRPNKGKRKVEEQKENLLMTGSDDDVGPKRLKLAPTVAVLCKNGGHNNFMKKAIAYLLQYRYHKAISTIIAGSERAKRALQGVVEKEVRKEVYYYCRTSEGFPQDSEISSFSWRSQLKEMESKMPMFYSTCYAAMDIRKGVDLVQSSASSGKRMIRPRLGLMMMLPLITRRERKFGCVMHTLSLLLHQFGSHEKVVGILHRLGVCQRSSKNLTQKVYDLGRTDYEQLLALASQNLAEMKDSTRNSRTKRKGKVPKASLPPKDGNSSERSEATENEQESDDEDTLGDASDDDGGKDHEEGGYDEAEIDKDDECDDDEENDEDDDDDDDDTSLLHMLSSDESGSDEDEEEDEEEEVGGGNDVTEEYVEVDGCVEDIEMAEVQLNVLLNEYIALKDRR